MRYDLSCEKFCIDDKKLDSDLLGDPVVEAAQERAAIAARVSELRKQRWGYCALTLDGDQAKIVISDQAAFSANCKDEVAELQELQRLNAMFQKLNPLFAEVQKEYPFIMSPTLTGLQQLKKDSIKTIDNLNRRIKNKAASICDSEILSKGMTLADVLKRPEFIKMKEENEKYIEAEKEKLQAYDSYIHQVKQILKGEE